MAEFVQLDIPLDARHAGTVRVVAAAVCADLGFSVDDAEELRLGVNEAVAILTDLDAPDEGRLQVRFDPVDGQLTVRCTRLGVDTEVGHANLDELARRILDAVVDEYWFDAPGSITVVKRRVASTT